MTLIVACPSSVLAVLHLTASMHFSFFACTSRMLGIGVAVSVQLHCMGTKGRFFFFFFKVQ